MKSENNANNNDLKSSPIVVALDYADKNAALAFADRIDPRVFFMLSAGVAALANGAVLLVEPTSPAVVGLRFVTGLCMAGVYPVGMKLASTWAKGDMGLVIGLLVGALTVGSALPHLFAFAGGLLAIVLVYRIAVTYGRLPIHTLLLAGVILNAVFSALIMFMTSIMSPERSFGMLAWLMGTLTAPSYPPHRAAPSKPSCSSLPA